MLRFVLRRSFFVLFAFHFFPSFSQTSWPASLLWRISGKGLQKPSYLFGTMHLPDRRLFYFGDSLYHALETTEGYAMEIDAAEMMDSVIRNTFREAEKGYLAEKQNVTLNRKKLGKSADSLLRSMGINGDVATKKQLKTIRDRRMANVLRQGEMPTMLDAYLLGLAQRLNKWTGGIEDVSDQLNLSDELGGALEPEQVLQPESAFQTAVERMIGIYLAQDLNAIERWSNSEYNPADKDQMLIRRNVKMAFRMDSLSHQRTMFFAVGAAHLPGDSGVISLLRSRGFTVEPVMSSTKTFAGDYAAKLARVAWKTVTGNDSAYTVQMPGVPSDYEMMGKLFKMKIFFDMTSMTFYMSGAVVNASAGEDKLDEMARSVVQNMTGQTKGVKIKSLASGSMSGREVETGNADASYRVRFYVKDKTVFLLMAGALKKAALSSGDADKFFASFVPGTTTVAAKPWQSFSLPGKGFSVQMPDAPEQNKAVDEQVASASNFRSLSYNTIDPQKGYYYLVQVREPVKGYMVENDSGFLQSMKDDYSARVGEIRSFSFGTRQGYPVLSIDGYVKKADAVYKILYATRGNRVYSLIAGVPSGQPTDDAERFLASFTLLPYETPQLYTQAIDGFSTTAPAPIKKQQTDTAKKSVTQNTTYLCANAVSAVNYQVFRQTFSPTYWARSDSSFFNAKLDEYKGYGDSILRKGWTKNGTLNGMEAWVQSPGDNEWKHVRTMINGDTLYTLYALVPQQDTGLAEHRRFFDDFRVAKEVAPSVYAPKTAALLKALQSTDSLTAADARSNLDLVEFGKADLPLLHNALLVAYADSNDYRSTGEKLVSLVSSLADSTTLDFIEKNYASLRGAKEAQRYNLLAVLAMMRTAKAYTALKMHLLSDLPKAGEPQQLQQALQDSLALTATLFPDLLQQAEGSLFGRHVVIVANNLLDSGLLSRTNLLSYSDKIMVGARNAFSQVKAGTSETWEFITWADLLSHLNTAEGHALLRQALPSKDLYLKQNIILALLRNNQPVPATEIAKVAADKSSRSSFYEDLKKLGKEALFPPVYATQKSLAESELYNTLTEDDEDVELVYAGERTEIFQGKQRRFYLFKARLVYDEDGGKKTYLAVAGPYSLNPKDKTVVNDVSGIYEDEAFTPAKLPQLLKAYLKQKEPAGE